MSRPRIARPLASIALGAAIGMAAVPARAADEVPADLARLRLDDGRHPFDLPSADAISVESHGEAQLRAERWTELPLQPPASDPSLRSLGQRSFGTDWVRVNGRASYRDRVQLVAQLDVAPNWIIGDLAQGIHADRAFAQDESVPAAVRLRYLYLDVATGIGSFRLGQVGSHWGMGILTNDGDHPSLFGDYRNGALVERAAFTTRPLGARSPLVVSIAADAIWQDAISRWSDGDRAYEGVATIAWDREPTFVGLWAARRNSQVRAFGNDGNLDVWELDATARHAASLGVDDAFLYAEAEAATLLGRTDAVRVVPDVPSSDVRSYGFAARVGIVKRASARGVEFGRFDLDVEAGFASGDGNPYDATLKRFTFDPNHVVGLVMFPFVMRAQTARAATNAMDPALGARPSPGAFLDATHGGVAGAQYLYPTIVVRPDPRFDLKLGALVAMATSDFVDPYVTMLQGSARNARGGDARSRDLGLELDWGFEWRAPLGDATLQLGLQQGILLPGHAFDDASGRSMPWQSVTEGRVGLQY